MTNARIVLRPTRGLVAVIGLAAIACGAAGTIGAVHDGGSVQAIATGVGFIAVSVVATVQYWAFYFVAIDQESIRQVKYFGLVRRTIPVSQLTGVAVEEEVTVFGVGIPLLRLDYAGGSLRLSSSRWSSDSVMQAAMRLRDWGVPVEGDVEAILGRGPRPPWNRGKAG
jgi:hypothetical protein